MEERTRRGFRCGLIEVVSECSCFAGSSSGTGRDSECVWGVGEGVGQGKLEDG